jgi:hypothetical protein
MDTRQREQRFRICSGESAEASVSFFPQVTQVRSPRREEPGVANMAFMKWQEFIFLCLMFSF